MKNNNKTLQDKIITGMATGALGLTMVGVPVWLPPVIDILQDVLTSTTSAEDETQESEPSQTGSDYCKADISGNNNRNNQVTGCSFETHTEWVTAVTVDLLRYDLNQTIDAEVIYDSNNDLELTSPSAEISVVPPPPAVYPPEQQGDTVIYPPSQPNSRTLVLRPRLTIAEGVETVLTPVPAFVEDAPVAAFPAAGKELPFVKSPANKPTFNGNLPVAFGGTDPAKDPLTEEPGEFAALVDEALAKPPADFKFPDGELLSPIVQGVSNTSDHADTAHNAASVPEPGVLTGIAVAAVMVRLMRQT
ncbi:MAG: hypothetical protein AAF959_10975 [Cyanobacteria bacterium P01_D01_bin.56]